MIIHVSREYSDLPLPYYATDGAAGMDIAAAESVTIPPGLHRVVKTGLRFQLALGWELQIRSRSGWAAKNQVFVLNSPGTLDSDYRGELLIILQNLGGVPFFVDRGIRIAQAVLCPVTRADVREVSEVVRSERGEGRFGSTGA
jgi:dUTP pyrophosphatase